MRPLGAEVPSLELDTISNRSRGLNSLRKLGKSTILSPSMRSGANDLTTHKGSSIQSKSIRLSTEEMKKTLETALMRNRKPEMEIKKRNILKNLTTLDPVNEDEGDMVN
jgi:hypothetical protein